MKLHFRKTGSGGWFRVSKTVNRYADGSFRCGSLSFGRLLFIITT